MAEPLTPELRAFAAELAKRVAPHHGQLLGHLAGIIVNWLAEPAPSSPPPDWALSTEDYSDNPAQLKRLLAERDGFIASEGLWEKFVKQILASSPPQDGPAYVSKDDSAALHDALLKSSASVHDGEHDAATTTPAPEEITSRERWLLDRILRRATWWSVESANEHHRHAHAALALVLSEVLFSLAEPAPSSPPHDGGSTRHGESPCQSTGSAGSAIDGEWEHRPPQASSRGAAATATPAPQGEAPTDAFIAELRNQATKIANYEGARDATIRLLNEAAARLTASRAPFEAQPYESALEKAIFERAHVEVAHARDEGFRAGVEAAAKAVELVKAALITRAQGWVSNPPPTKTPRQALELATAYIDGAIADILALSPPAPPSGGDALDYEPSEEARRDIEAIERRIIR